MTPRRLSRLALIPLLLGFPLGLPAWACLNQYGKKNVHGETMAPGGESPNSYFSRLQGHYEHDTLVAGPAPTEPAATADYKARSDYAVALVHRGESKKAVAILEAVEKEHPGEYIVAANLGTAYELSGDLDRAKDWIGEGIRRNPKSHDGSEWLHLKILDARQALAKDPEWAKSHGVLDLDFGDAPAPRKPTAWPQDSGEAEGVIKALTYQLSERLAFVPPPDVLVAGMLADLADLLSLYRSVDHAIPVYELASQYHPARADRVASRLASSMQVRAQEKALFEQVGRSEFLERTLLAVAFGASAIGIFFWIRKGRAAA